jgi:peptidoglycan/LPS O-acetylase OafA/YrhL
MHDPKVSSAPNRPHLACLDGIRALAAVFVVLHHIFLQRPVAADAMRITRAAAWSFHRGHYAVSLFIVLSGFCLMIPLTRPPHVLSGGPLIFFAKRGRRILPPYFFATAVSLILIATLVGEKTGTHWDLCVPVSLYDVTMHSVLLQDIDQSTSVKINHAFWSISVEWRIYFLFPLLVWFWRRAGVGWTVALVALTSAVVWAALLSLRPMFPSLNLELAGICPHYLLLFVFGMFAANLALAPTIAQPSTKRLPSGLAFVAAVALYRLVTSTALRLERFDEPAPWVVQDVAFGLGCACLLAWVANPNAGRLGAGLRRLFSWGPLAFLGTFAYSIYLIHAPVIQVVWQYAALPLTGQDELATWATALLGTPAILLAAYLFFIAFEKPFMSVRQRSEVTKS